MSRALTVEECRAEFLKKLAHLIGYWAKRPGTVEERMGGLVFSILVMIDGGAGGFPPLKLIPEYNPANQKFRESKGEDYWPDGINLSDPKLEELHGEWNKYRPDVKR